MFNRVVGVAALSISLLTLPSAADHRQIRQTRGLPARFEQISSEFILRGVSYAATLDANGAEIRPRGSSKSLRIEFEQAAGQLDGLDPTGASSNYLIGSSDRWKTNVSHFRRVRSTSVWPRIDIVYRTTDADWLEFDFIVHPGGNPEMISLRWLGADAWRLTESGALALTVDSREIHIHRPFAYQSIRGRNVVVPAAFRVRGNGATFVLGAWDRRHALVIDPVLSYASYVGGASDETGVAGTTDQAGRAFLCGTTKSADFPTTPGAPKSVYAEDGTDPALGDIFVAAFDPAGALLFATYLGGTRYDECRAIAVDPNGGIYVTGQTHSTNFGTTAGAYRTTFGGSTDAFVVKLNAAGNVVSYSTFMGGSENDYGDAVAADATGSAYVVVNTLGGGFPTTPGVFAPTSITGAYLVKLNPNGTGLTYSTFLGRGGYLFGLERLEIGGGRRVAVDAAGNAFVAGNTVFSSFPTTAGAAYRVYRGGNDGYIMKINASASSLVYSSLFGGTADDYVEGLVIDDTGNAFVVGDTTTREFPDATVIGPTDQSGMFVVKFNSAGSAVHYATRVTGSDDSYMGGATLARGGGIVLAGYTYASDFPVTSNAVQKIHGGGADGVVISLSPDGERIIHATFIGGAAFDWVSGIGLDSTGAAYLIGSTQSANFPVTGSAGQTLGGPSDAFVAKISGFERPPKRRSVRH